MNRTQTIMLRQVIDLSTTATTIKVPAGYYAIFNATHYEVDANIYCPIGTVVFEALLLVEDPNDVFLILVDFQSIGGSSTFRHFEPFSINGMGNSDVIDPVTGDVSIIITTDQTLNSNDTVCEFQLTVLVATGFDTQSVTTNAIVHKRGDSVDDSTGDLKKNKMS
ncbi:uncharacterized protein [Dysidea avara]|uniref:uncharacterized protein isoform X2 n=1 Tax=Dysidea avara TaxID=196820 RepID=UPI003329F0EA